MHPGETGDVPLQGNVLVPIAVLRCALIRHGSHNCSLYLILLQAYSTGLLFAQMFAQKIRTNNVTSDAYTC